MNEVNEETKAWAHGVKPAVGNDVVRLQSIGVVGNDVVRRRVIFSTLLMLSDSFCDSDLFCSWCCQKMFLIGYAARTVPKGKTFGQQSLPRWYQYRQLVVTIICLIHAHDQDVGDLGLFDNRDVLSVAHTSLQEASIGEP